MQGNFRIISQEHAA